MVATSTKLDFGILDRTFWILDRTFWISDRTFWDFGRFLLILKGKLEILGHFGRFMDFCGHFEIFG